MEGQRYVQYNVVLLNCNSQTDKHYIVPATVRVALLLVSASPSPFAATHLTVVRFSTGVTSRSSRPITLVSLPATGVVVLVNTGLVPLGGEIIHVMVGEGMPLAVQLNSTTSAFTARASLGLWRIVGSTV